MLACKDQKPAIDNRAICKEDALSFSSHRQTRPFLYTHLHIICTGQWQNNCFGISVPVMDRFPTFHSENLRKTHSSIQPYVTTRTVYNSTGTYTVGAAFQWYINRRLPPPVSCLRLVGSRAGIVCVLSSFLLAPVLFDAA